MRHFEFFTEKDRNLFGERFGRAIEYQVEKDDYNDIHVGFSPDIILGEDERNNTELPSKEKLVNSAIYELAQKYKKIMVELRVYRQFIVAYNSDSLEDVAEKFKQAQCDYLKKLDIY